MEQKQTPQSSISTSTKQHIIPVGKMVGGRYKIQTLLGQGGFGRSYLVADTQRFNELCVLKEFSPTSQSQQLLQKAIDLFKKEAKTLYQINHPQIPKFLAGFTQSQRLFIVQEHVNGTTYAQLLRQRQEQRQLFSEAEVIQWLRQMLPVLDYLHSLNLIHRDISPDNVMFSCDLRLPVLIDFGLVKDAIQWSASADASSLPRQMSMIGKFGYSPPEQLRMGHCYPCSDLYALGVTAIVLLTGRHPGSLIDSESLQWNWQSRVTLKTSLGKVLEKLVMPKPKDRFQTAQEALKAMQSLPVAIPELAVQSVGQSETPQAKQIGRSAGTSAPLSGRSPISAPTTSAFVEQCRQVLAHCVGPMANVLIDEILAQYPYLTLQGFIETLTSHISDPSQATDFRRRIQIPQGLNSEQQLISGPDPKDVSSNRALNTGNLTSQEYSDVASALNPAFVDVCRRELIHCIGPIAELVIRNVIANNPGINHEILVEALATNIPDTRKAAEFRQRLKSIK